MEIKQVVIVVRGTKGEAKRVVLDTAGNPVSGDKDVLGLVESVLEPAGPPSSGAAVLDSANEVTDYSEPRNEVWSKE